MRYLLLLLLMFPFLQACEVQPTKAALGLVEITPDPPHALFINEIPLPQGFHRRDTAQAPFTQWLRKLPLRKDNVLRLWDGRPKPNQSLHYAILDVPYTRDPLQQCADAVMRMRAEYLYATKAQPSISFLHQRGKYFTCATNCTRSMLEQFLKNVFNWCGTYNLAAQLKPVPNIMDVVPGDVFIKAGSPGHAMLVADVAQNAKGEKIFLLMQSFMPAQEIHLVKNTFHTNLSPWYSATESMIYTPGWYFKPADLKRW